MIKEIIYSVNKEFLCFMNMVYEKVEHLSRLKDLNLEDENNIDFDITDFKDIEEILRDCEENGDEEKKETIKRENLDISEKEKRLQPYLDKNRKENPYKLVTRRIDNNRIRNKTAKSQEVFTGILKNVRMASEGPIRSGAIIYTKKNGKTYFCLGVDNTYGDLTDLSGGIRKSETVIEGGLRELEEESLGVFGKISPEDIKDCMGFYCNNMLIMFIRKDVNMEKIKQEFDKRLEKRIKREENNTKEEERENIEVSAIVWLDTKEFLKSIQGKGRKLYSRVRRILGKVTDIIAAI